MKKITILIAFLFFFILAFSQEEKGLFSIYLDKDNKIQITGDSTKEYDNFEFTFSNEFKNDSLDFFDAQSRAISVFNGSKLLGKDIGDGASKDGFVIVKIISDKNNHYVDGFSAPIDKVVPPVFTIKIGDKFIGTFLLKPTSGDVFPDMITYQPGYIYYDAMKLVNSSIDIKIKNKILGYYSVDNKNNIFLSPYIIKKWFGSENHSGTGASSILTNLGNTDVTYFAAGIARFLADRAKEELNEAFFYGMKEKLNSYPELKTVFPTTASFLNKIETYSYASVIQVLKEAFETDIQNLPAHLYDVKYLSSTSCDTSLLNACDLTKCQNRMDWLSSFFNTRDGRWIGLGMFTVKETVQTTNPANLLKAIAGSEELKGIKMSSKDSLHADYNIASSIELSNFISQSLISKDDNQVWITSKELNALITNDDAFKIYLGLLLSFEQRNDANKQIFYFYKTDNVKIPTTFGDILIQAHGSIDYVRSLIKNTYTAYNTANNAVKKILAASDKSVEADPQALYDYYRTFNSSLKLIVTSPFLKQYIRKDYGVGYAKVELILNPAVDIAYSISTKKYSSAIYNTALLLTNIESNSNEKPVLKSFIKYGTLISTVANAQSSDEVKQAMEASVLPVGSSAIKRNSSWSISINGYVGAYWSYANKKKDTYPTLGLSSPIGINISKGISPNGNCGGFSLNLQILDLGSLVNYYLIKGDTASIQNNFSVKLSNIFAPGFNLCYNIPKTPLSIAWGGQYIPTLYKYEQINGKNDLTPINTWRWQLSLLIDIPLFNLKVWDFK